MNWLSAHWLHLAFILIYLCILIRHAWAGHKKVHSLDDYLVAGRGLGGWVIGLSFYATFMSTNTFIGAAGKSWSVGLVWCVGGIVLVACCCVSWFVVAPKFVPLTRQYKSLTVADFLGARYESMTVRKLAAWIVCFSSVIYLVAIYRGSALALVQLLELPYLWAVVLIFIVVTSYTLAGGFESVVLTDALQGLLMIVGALAMIGAILWRGGGLDSMLTELANQDRAFVSWEGHMPISTILALSLAVGIKYLVEPRQLSRFYGLKDGTALRVASILAPLLIIVTYGCLLPVGALAHVFIPSEAIQSSDEVVPYLLSAENIFGSVIGTLFLLVLISAAMSSIDSVLLVAASTIDRDIVTGGKYAAGSVRRTRYWVVAVSLASMLVGISPFTKDIVSVTAFSGSLYGACFLPALVLGMFWARPTTWAAVTSMLLGAMSVVLAFTARQFGWQVWSEVYIGLAVGLGSYLLVGICVAPRPAPTRRIS